MVHGQDAVEAAPGSGAEEAVGGEGSEGEDALGLGLLDGGCYLLLLLGAEQAAVAGVRVEAQHGDLGTVDAEVLRQRLAEVLDLVQDEILGDGGGDVLDWKVSGGHGHAHQVVEENH